MLSTIYNNCNDRVIVAEHVHVCGGVVCVCIIGTSLLCFYLLCYAAVLINFTYYAQYYAHVKDLCCTIL